MLTPAQTDLMERILHSRADSGRVGFRLGEGITEDPEYEPLRAQLDLWPGAPPPGRGR